MSLLNAIVDHPNLAAVTLVLLGDMGLFVWILHTSLRGTPVPPILGTLLFVAVLICGVSVGRCLFTGKGS